MVVTVGSYAVWPSRLDPSAMGVPDVSSVRLHRMAEELRACAVGMAGAVSAGPAGGLSAAVGPAVCWEGSAADAFDGWTADFDAPSSQAVTVAASAASALRGLR